MNNKFGSILLISFISMFTISSCGASEKTSVMEGLTDIVVQGSKSEEENAFCKNFSLNEKQAKVFFQRSKIIDAKMMHDKYDHLPCYVYGTLKHDSNTCTWEIRAGGTAFIQCPSKEYIIACDNCDDILKD